MRYVLKTNTRYISLKNLGLPVGSGFEHRHMRVKVGVGALNTMDKT